MKRTIKMTITILLTVVLLVLLQTCVKAASADLSAKSKTVEVGDKITVTAKVTAAQWDLTIKANGKVIASSSELDNYKSNITKNFSGTYTATEKGTVTFTLEGDITDFNQTNTIVNKKATVTVKEKTTSTTNNGGNTGTTTTAPKFTNKNETVYAKSEVNVRASYSTSSSKLGTLKKGDSVKRTGIATSSVSGILWSKVTYNGKTAYISSSFLTTTKPTTTGDKDNNNDTPAKSSNKNLKSLSVTPTGLGPAFAAGTTEYTMTVGSETQKVDVVAVAEDAKSKVEVSGNTELKVGTNKIKIVVTAEDKSTKTYTITVTKENKVQLKLEELLIAGLPLKPEFDSNVYEYTLDLEKSDVTELNNITATPNKQNAEVEILGNTDLKVGANIVTILIKSANGEETATYQITVNVPKPATPAKTENKDFIKYIGIGAGIIIVLIIIIVIISRGHKNDEDDDEEMQDVTITDEENDLKAGIDVQELPNLEEEELPKFLRKSSDDKVENKEETESKEEEKADFVNEEDKDKKRSKKLEELYSVEDEQPVRKRGKHF